MRYDTPCVEDVESLLCLQCEEGRCVVVEFRDEGVPSVEHVSSDDLIVDPFGPGAIAVEP